MNFQTQTGWVSRHPQEICQDPEYLKRCEIFTYPTDGEAWRVYCVSRVGVPPDLTTWLYRAKFQQAWELFTPFPDYLRVWTENSPSTRRYIHGMPIDTLLGRMFLQVDGRLSHYSSGRIFQRDLEGMTPDEAINRKITELGIDRVLAAINEAPVLNDK